MRINHSNYALLPFWFIVSLLDHKLLWEEKDIFSSFLCLIFSRAFHRRGANTNLLNEWTWLMYLTYTISNTIWPKQLINIMWWSSWHFIKNRSDLRSPFKLHFSNENHRINFSAFHLQTLHLITISQCPVKGNFNFQVYALIKLFL